MPRSGNVTTLEEEIRRKIIDFVMMGSDFAYFAALTMHSPLCLLLDSPNLFQGGLPVQRYVFYFVHQLVSRRSSGSKIRQVLKPTSNASKHGVIWRISRLSSRWPSTAARVVQSTRSCRS